MRPHRVGRVLAACMFVLAALVVTPVTTEPAAAQTGGVEFLTDVFVFRSSTALSSDPCPNVSPRGQYTWDENNLNSFSLEATFLYFCKRYDPPEGRGPFTPLTDIRFVSRTEKSTAPCTDERYTPIRSAAVAAQDLNEGNGGRFIYGCITRDPAVGGVLLDLDAVYARACSRGYDLIEQNLNQGTFFASALQFPCVLRYVPADYVYSCGNENERRCSPGDFFDVNGSTGGCDRGLKPDGDGICRDDTRRSSRVDDFIGSWAHWALLNQTNQLAYDVPMSRYTQIGAHNGFNSYADGYVLPNQAHSLTDQLRAGIRVLDLDIYTAPGFSPLPKLCHGSGDGGGGCSLTERLLDSAIKEIRNWLLEPANRNETIVILVEDYVSDVQSELGVLASINTHLNVPEIGVVSDSQLKYAVTPTRREMLEAGTRVAIFSQNAGFGDLVHLKTGADDLWEFGSGILVSDYDESTCTGENVRPPVIGTGFANISEVNEDRVFNPAANVGTERLADLVHCGLNIINLDFVLGVGFERNRLHSAIWSWAPGDRGQNGDAVMFDGGTGRWHSRPSTAERRYACRVGSELRISRFGGPWVGGWQTCAEEFPGGAFFVPVNGWENRQLMAANTDGADLWINYNDIAQPGQFVVTGSPAINITAPETVTERIVPYTVYFGFADPTAADLVSAEIDCGSGVFLGGEYTTRGGQFFCQFLSAGTAEQNYSDEIINIEVVSNDGTVVNSSHVIRVENAPPVINTAGVRVEPGTSVTEGSTVRLTVPFSDPGVPDRHRLRVAWGDGSTDDVEVPAQQQTVSIEHVYLDDNPSGTAIDRPLIEMWVSDESATSRATVRMEVANVAPVVTALDLRTAGRVPVGDGGLPLLPGLPVDLSVSFTDAGAGDTHRTVIDWGDGSARSLGPTATHVFRAVGPATIDVSVTDDDGGIGTGRLDVEVIALDAAIEQVIADVTAIDDGGRDVQRAIRFLDGSFRGATANGADDALRADRPQLAEILLDRALLRLQRVERRTGNTVVTDAVAVVEAVLVALDNRPLKPHLPQEIDLPSGFFPEGIAKGRNSTFFVGSLSTGTIARGDLRTGEVEVITEPLGAGAVVGLAVDRYNRVWAAGGASGTARVFDGDTGELLATYQLTAPGDSFINDVVIHKDVAWFTDSGTRLSSFDPRFGPPGEPRLFSIPADFRLPSATAIVEMPLAIPDIGFPNLNGIESLPGGGLVVAHSSLGLLYRVATWSGEVQVIDVGGTIAGVDGLVRDDRLLYAVGRGNTVTEIRLRNGDVSGVLRRRLNAYNAESTTTALLFADGLYLPDARFFSSDDPYRVYRIDLG